jgi:hypothetical protein
VRIEFECAGELVRMGIERDELLVRIEVEGVGVGRIVWLDRVGVEPIAMWIAHGWDLLVRGSEILARIPE